jgi:propanol-preferring alcohol dehydrogenase
MLLNHTAPIDSAPLRLVDLPAPNPGQGELRLRVSCCAICRTDLHVVEGDLAQQRMPVVPGHQIVGRVDALGPGCRQTRIGRRVGVAWLRHTCGRCPFCTTGRENLCEHSQFTGYHADGGYAEYAIVPEAYAYERDIHSVTSNTREDGRELLAEAAAIPLRTHTTVYPPG